MCVILCDCECMCTFVRLCVFDNVLSSGELIDCCAGLGSVGCLLSIVVLGAAIDDVLPGHADKVDNFVVVVVRLQLLGRNKP